MNIRCLLQETTTVVETKWGSRLPNFVWNGQVVRYGGGGDGEEAGGTGEGGRGAMFPLQICEKLAAETWTNSTGLDLSVVCYN